MPQKNLSGNQKCKKKINDCPPQKPPTCKQKVNQPVRLATETHLQTLQTIPGVCKDCGESVCTCLWSKAYREAMKPETKAREQWPRPTMRPTTKYNEYWNSLHKKQTIWIMNPNVNFRTSETSLQENAKSKSSPSQPQKPDKSKIHAKPNVQVKQMLKAVQTTSGGIARIPGGQRPTSGSCGSTTITPRPLTAKTKLDASKLERKISKHIEKPLAQFHQACSIIKTLKRTKQEYVNSKIQSKKLLGNVEAKAEHAQKLRALKTCITEGTKILHNNLRVRFKSPVNSEECTGHQASCSKIKAAGHETSQTAAAADDKVTNPQTPEASANPPTIKRKKNRKNTLTFLDARRRYIRKKPTSKKKPQTKEADSEKERNLAGAEISAELSSLRPVETDESKSYTSEVSKREELEKPSSEEQKKTSSEEHKQPSSEEHEQLSREEHKKPSSEASKSGEESVTRKFRPKRMLRKRLEPISRAVLSGKSSTGVTRYVDSTEMGFTLAYHPPVWVPPQTLKNIWPNSPLLAPGTVLRANPKQTI